MEDLAAFASSHPQLSDPAKIRVPGLGSLPVLDGARTFGLTPEGLQSFRAPAPKDPETLPRMLKQGPEAVAFYVSFRFGADRWGVYIREAGLHAPPAGPSTVQSLRDPRAPSSVLARSGSILRSSR